MPDTTTRIDLPGGEWAEMAPPDDITGADVEAVLAAVDLGDIDMETMDSRALGKFMLRLMPQINPGLVATLCRSWSLVDRESGEPLPIDVATVRAQRATLLRPLYVHVAPGRSEVMAAFGLGGTDPKSAAS